MRSRLLLVPIATVMSVPACAAESETYLSVEQAQQLLFPGATFKADFVTMSDKQYAAIRDASNTTVWAMQVNAWRTSTGGWFVVDRVQGRDDALFYAIGIDGSGAVTGIEIMECLPQFGDVRIPAWRKQFVGLRQAQISPDKIKTISGATLSSTHIRDGVRRVLATYDVLLKQRH